MNKIVILQINTASRLILIVAVNHDLVISNNDMKYSIDVYFFQIENQTIEYMEIAVIRIINHKRPK